MTAVGVCRRLIAPICAHFVRSTATGRIIIVGGADAAADFNSGRYLQFRLVNSGPIRRRWFGAIHLDALGIHGVKRRDPEAAGELMAAIDQFERPRPSRCLR